MIGTTGVVLASLLTASPATAIGQAVDVTWSSEDGSYALAPRPVKQLGAPTTIPTDTTINIDPAATYQSILGQGQSLESSSVGNIARLSPEMQHQLLTQLFDPVHGNGYNLIRLSMGCPDFCSEEFYTYDDMPAGQTDEALSGFSIQKDIRAGIIALARRALAINPGVRFYMSMWSAPAWMKSNGDLSGGGYVKPEHYDELARYQRMAIQAYEAEGIPIHALSPQNEPRVVVAYPTGEWTGEQMRDYIRDHLGPELRSAGLSTQIWIGDDNPPRLKDFVPAILDDSAAAAFVSGVAIHDYSGDDPSVLSEFALRYPEWPIHLTERTYYGVNGELNRFDGSWQSGIQRVMQLYRNGLSSWTYWLSFLDTDGEPNTGPLRAECCALPFTVPAGDPDGYTTNRDYYLYGQFARYVGPGAVRIGSDQTAREVSNVAFRNPDGTIVVVVANVAASERSVTLVSPDGAFTDTLPAQTVATYRWAGTTAQTDALVGTFRLENRAAPTLALQNTRETYLGNPDATHTAATPAGWNTLEQRWTITSAAGGYYRLTSASAPSRVLHTTGERYNAWTDVWNVAVVSSSLNWDEQLWRITSTSDGYVKLVNKARGTALQVAGESYRGWSAVKNVVSSPDSWTIPEQEFRLVAD